MCVYQLTSFCINVYSIIYLLSQGYFYFHLFGQNPILIAEYMNGHLFKHIQFI